MLRDKTNTLKVNRSHQTSKPLQSLRRGFQTTTGKNKESLSNLATDNPELKTPTLSSQVNTPTYQHTSILHNEGQQAPQKKILIAFEQALQVRVVDQIKAHLKLSVDKFQGGCIKLY